MTLWTKCADVAEELNKVFKKDQGLYDAAENKKERGNKKKKKNEIPWAI